MKQLFLKSNLLHIRTNEGEFEVSNPEIVGKFGIRILSESFILRYPLFTKDGYILLEGNDEAEWPYGVELIDKCVYWSFDGMCHKCKNGSHCKKLARLLPKEEKREMTNKEVQELLIVNEAINKHRWESDYKEPQDKEQLIGLIIDDFKNGKEIFVPSVESSEPQEDRFNQALIEVPQDIKDQVEFEHNAINEAWELWGNIAKKDNVNPQAFVFGYVEAKKKYAVSAPSESQFDLPPAVVFNLQQIALADDDMVKQPGAAEQYRFIARHILELFTRNP